LLLGGGGPRPLSFAGLFFVAWPWMTSFMLPFFFIVFG